MSAKRGASQKAASCFPRLSVFSPTRVDAPDLWRNPAFSTRHGNGICHKTFPIHALGSTSGLVESQSSQGKVDRHTVNRRRVHFCQFLWIKHFCQLMS
jgi:hypothetical protein